MKRIAALFFALMMAFAPGAFADPEDHYATNGKVKIHYVAEGSGPLVVMLHGFPGWWYSWSPMMGALKDKYRVVALDMRGYNLSDKPKAVDAYKFPELVEDVDAVIKAEGKTSAIIIGHDWGGAVAWQVAMTRPDLVNHLIVLSTPHPAGLTRELATNVDQQKNSEYARNFQKPGAEKSLTAEGLAQSVPEPDKQKYIEAYKRSSFTSMLNYYRANYPSDTGAALAPPATFPKIKAPTLVIHGEKDTSLMAAGHNGTWEQVDADTTILMIPNGGHFVQYDALPMVNRTVRDWLDARP